MTDLRRRSAIESTLVLVLLGGAAVFIAYGALRVYILKQRFAGGEAETQAKIQAKEKEIAELRGEIQKLKSGEGIEFEARNRLNLQKPDERVLVIIDGEKKVTPSQEIPIEGLFDRIKHWLGFGNNEN